LIIIAIGNINSKWLTMSKADNIKRAKLLRKNKRERENPKPLNDQLAKDQQKLINNADIEGIKVVDRAIFNGKKKISNLVLEMLTPLLIKAKSEEEIRIIVALGITAWNSGIIKDIRGPIALNETLNEFDKNANPKEFKLLEEFISIKCSKYKKYLDFITDYELSFENSGRALNLTVLTDLTDGLLKKHQNPPT
jgi:hypothetical protein